jgi:hypothetical protein
MIARVIVGRVVRAVLVVLVDAGVRACLLGVGVDLAGVRGVALLPAGVLLGVRASGVRLVTGDLAAGFKSSSSDLSNRLSEKLYWKSEVGDSCGAGLSWFTTRFFGPFVAGG